MEQRQPPLLRRLRGLLAGLGQPFPLSAMMAAIAGVRWREREGEGTEVEVEVREREELRQPCITFG